MKIRFVKQTTVDVEARDGEFYDKAYPRWAEIRVDALYPSGKFTTIKLENGDVLHGVPADSFEKVMEEKRVVTL